MVPDPPVKKNVSPTIPLPKSLTINNARLAISSTVDIRPDGFAFHSKSKSPSTTLPSIGVAVGPGAIPLTTIPYLINLSAKPNVNPFTAL